MLGLGQHHPGLMLFLGTRAFSWLHPVWVELFFWNLTTNKGQIPGLGGVGSQLRQQDRGRGLAERRLMREAVVTEDAVTEEAQLVGCIIPLPGW